MMHTQPIQRPPAAAFAPGRVYPMTVLTPRDLEVIALVVAGQTNAAIASRLGMQLQTTKNVLSGIYDKLGVSTRLELAVLFLRGQPGTASRGTGRRVCGCTLPPQHALSPV
jgi:DNA-binding NarL/FixJ family response regulator